MALQDLTPQLRTRLSRMERAVGWFVLLATALLLAGFTYYLVNTAANKGWFLQKVRYHTCLATATGLKVGDPILLMGFKVGEITAIEANSPWDYYGITVFFRVKKPYFGYILSDSTVKAAAADFLGGRVLEITKGQAGVPTVQEAADKRATGLLRADYFKQQLAAQLVATSNHLGAALAALNQAAKANSSPFYEPLDGAQSFFLTPAESPAVTERLDRIVGQVEAALPSVLRLTNDLALVLANAATASSNLAVVSASARPMAENFAALSEQLRGEGALGAWLFAPDARGQLTAALTNANALLANTDTNLAVLTGELAKSLENLAGITSNLHAQVNANTNLVREVSDAIVHADELMQGLKRHWLLRSAFREPKTNAAPTAPAAPARAPNDPFRR